MASVPRADLDQLLSAVQNPTRRAILVALLADRRPVSVDDVALMLEVHRTVAFGHLEHLADSGLLVKELRRGRRGKPAALYTAVGGALTAAVPQRQFAQLAQLLAEGLGTLRGRGQAVAREAGRRYGESLGGPPAADVVQALAPLQALGGEYEVDGGQITARNCIFLEACRSGSDVVCGLQAGLIEGALKAGGITAGVQPGGPVSGGGCTYLLTAS
jgi:predicted ArsR family transcriptional regulator